MKEITDGVWGWSVYHPEKGYDFNGLHLDLGGMAVLVDPPPLTDEEMAKLGELKRPERILLTNKDHRRDAPHLRSAFDAPIWLHQADAPLIDCKVDHPFDDDAEVAPGLYAVRVPRNKSPGECALWWKARRILILGDALIGDPPGTLRLLPAGKYANVAAAREGIRALEDLPAHMVLVGDGACILEDGAAAIRTFLEGR